MGPRRAGWVCDRRGVAALEFALIVPVLLLMFLGMVDIGFSFYERSRLNQATRETAEATTYTRDAARLTQILQSELAALGPPIGGGTYVGDPVTLDCACSGTTVSCYSNCSDGTPAGIFATIRAEVTHNAFILGAMHLESNLLIRLR